MGHGGQLLPDQNQLNSAKPQIAKFYSFFYNAYLNVYLKGEEIVLPEDVVMPELDDQMEVVTPLEILQNIQEERGGPTAIADLASILKDALDDLAATRAEVKRLRQENAALREEILEAMQKVFFNAYHYHYFSLTRISPAELSLLRISTSVSFVYNDNNMVSWSIDWFTGRRNRRGSGSPSGKGLDEDNRWFG